MEGYRDVRDRSTPSGADATAASHTARHVEGSYLEISHGRVSDKGTRVSPKTQPTGSTIYARQGSMSSFKVLSGGASGRWP